MTIEEFNQTSFGAGDRIIDKRGNVHDLASVDFEEALFGYSIDPDDEENPLSWARCENCEFIPIKN